MDVSLKWIALSLCRKKTLNYKNLATLHCHEKKMAKELNHDDLSESKNCRKKQ